MATTEERAERIIDFWLNDKSPDFKIRSNIRREIAAAIEEEREACARDADDEATRARELQARRGDYGGDTFRAGITQGRAQAASLIAARIRARSETKTNGVEK